MHSSSLINTTYANQSFQNAIRSTAYEEGFNTVRNVGHLMKLRSDEKYQQSVRSYRRMENTTKVTQNMVIAGSHQKRVFGVSQYAPRSEGKLSLHNFMERISMDSSSEFLVNLST